MSAIQLDVTVADNSVVMDGTDEGFRCQHWMGVTSWVVAVTALGADGIESEPGSGVWCLACSRSHRVVVGW